jgi:hypothetical protein
MNRQPDLRLFLIAVGFVILLAGAGQAQVNGTEAPAAVSASDSVPGRISYQGRLVEGGSPVNGNRNMIFRFYSSGACSGSPVQSVTKNNVPVQNGLFHVALDVNPAQFSGSGRWLQVEAGGVAYGCEEILPAPYALHSLTTGAHNHLGETWSGDNPGGSALRLINLGATGATYGVLGESASVNGNGVRGVATANTGVAFGVYGQANSTSGAGVRGAATAGAGDAIGVWGTSASTSGYGLYGRATAGTGTTYGVYGESNSTSGHGVYGWASTGTGTTYGVRGLSNSTNGRGVQGVASAGTGSTFGVVGLASSTNGAGVIGQATANNVNAIGVWGFATQPTAYAGFFNGRVHVTGNLSASGTKSFKIDHPLDPENMYLYHFALESPEVRNVYDGVATLDAKGEATVPLPDYFAALNTGDYRYQLTPIGAPMPGLYIAQEIEGNSFAIGGGEPGMRVSWQVTAVRNDPYLRDHPIQAEVEKLEEERGTYLYPQGYGRPETEEFRYQLLLEQEVNDGS